MNGSKRAALIIAQDTFVARIIVAIATLGEVVALVSKPQKGRPLMYFQTADGQQIKFDMFAPPNVDGGWRINADHGAYEKTWSKLDLVDVEPIAKVIVKPIANQRAERAARVIAARLNESMPTGSPLRVRTDNRGGLGLDVLRVLNEAQLVALIDAARACGLLDVHRLAP